MENLLKLGLTEKEALELDEQIEQMLAAMRKANEQKEHDWMEIERLKAQTNILLADLERKLGGRDVETTLRTV
ncbi:MAG: hypothetical protein JST85_11580 [Acidobacteria bacterium]|nr:hypothetical protein [Acidobacteriota bacterium]